MCQKHNPKEKWNQQEKLTIRLVDDICIFVTIWDINPSRSSCCWQLKKKLSCGSSAAASLAENDINTQTFRGKTPADYQLEVVYLSA